MEQVSNVDWRQKIRKLLEGRNASELATSVGLHKSAIRDAANTGRMPRVGKAVKIAKALGVETGWLFDDTREWPPPEVSSRAELSVMQQDFEWLKHLFRRSEVLLDSVAQRVAPLVGDKGTNARQSMTREERAELANMAFALLGAAQSYEHLGVMAIQTAMQTKGFAKIILEDILKTGIGGTTEQVQEIIDRAGAVALSTRDSSGVAESEGGGQAGREREHQRRLEIEKKRGYSRIQKFAAETETEAGKPKAADVRLSSPKPDAAASFRGDGKSQEPRRDRAKKKAKKHK